MSAGRLNVGVIGLGVGERHVAAFANHSDCELVAICDTNAAKLDQVGQSYPQAKRYASAERLLNDPEINVAVIASYDDAHAEQIVRAIETGKHVFAEKPLCRTADELAQIRRAMKQNPPIKLTSNTLLRNSPRFRDLRDRIEAGAMGRIYCIEADYLYGRFHKITHGWRGQIQDYSVMLGGGIHMIDLVLWIAGERPVEATAIGNSLVSQGTGFAGPDCVIALLRFPSGMIAKIGANFGCVHPHFHRFTAWGTKATFDNTLAVPQGAACLWESADSAVGPKLLNTAYPGVDKGILIPSFVDAILGRGRATVSADETFAAVSVCLAVDAAQKSGRTVAIDYN